MSLALVIAFFLRRLLRLVSPVQQVGPEKEYNCARWANEWIARTGLYQVEMCEVDGRRKGGGMSRWVAWNTIIFAKFCNAQGRVFLVWLL